MPGVAGHHEHRHPTQQPPTDPGVPQRIRARPLTTQPIDHDVAPLVDLDQFAQRGQEGFLVALAEQVVLYRSATRLGLAETAARTGQIMKKHHALARRLIDRQADYLRFTTNFAVPPDNNGSERDIRMIKVRQKISGCLRTLTGAQQFCAIRSYISTAAKHGRHAFDTLVMLAEGRPWLPA
jgi:hypothetical protein